MDRMNVAIVGTGFVAEFYGNTLDQHPELHLVGAYDRNPGNLSAFCRRWPVRAYASLTEMLKDPSVDMVLNLTNPRSHFEVSARCLEAGKHTYSEKPLAMDSGQASELVALARRRGVYLASAPCSVLSETAQTVWKAVVDNAVGRVRLVYANFDEGMIAPNFTPWNMINGCGVPWPAKDEFEVGCTYEHAGYVLTWLAAFFGPAKTVTSFSSCQIPDKGIPVDKMAPDFSVGCIEYGNGIVARVTCSLVAPLDKSLTIIGETGIIYTSTVRYEPNPVYVQHIPPHRRLTRIIERQINRVSGWAQSCLPITLTTGDDWHIRRKYPFARRPTRLVAGVDKPVDFNRGPAELAEAVRQRRPCRLSGELGLHIVELLEALQYPERFGGRRRIDSTFHPIQPLSWIS